MPYIKLEKRDELNRGGSPNLPGEINYLVYQALTNADIRARIVAYLSDEQPNYSLYNDVFGAMYLAVSEYIRRNFPNFATYEDQKCLENGDVFRR